MNVLVIPEDFRKDQYILKPIIQAMFNALGKPRARVQVLTDPLMGGIASAMDLDVLKDVVERYQGMVDIFILCVDRDGQAHRHEGLKRLEEAIGPILPCGKVFLSEHAWQELEVWVLAGLTLPKDWIWDEVRSERDPKERFFNVFAKDRGLLDEPGEGRKTLGLEAARSYGRVRHLCPEDIQRLEGRIPRALGQK